ncbi:uncharacterized protein LOC110448029 [Mizuhopecten yessoensis]|uniref:Ly6/PLAUR domain-containing protein 6B n=1 Tax=Mizuhopecten yessoensis TaxID=6573 RepID=A0A210QU03_MIZYE|nr:uncharacterized protein LOC110448029 [Mizuhopecten yessoensis]OWF52228.1 hypothetical protein KP79_PYT04099 [Mizuhopecten yessoensis]
MKELSTYSGIIIVALQFITVSGLECITCDWNAGQTNGTDDCVSAPYELDRQQCETTGNNNVYSCETTLTFKMVKTRSYLESISRGCKLQHYYCNKECNPAKKKDCFLCCEEGGCNSVPFSMGLLPFSLYYNTTSEATPTTCVFRGLLTAEVLLASWMILN